MDSHTAERPAVATREDHGLGTVVAPHEQAVRAGMTMYEHGGNAVDAAVAAALVSGVIEPAETTLAGCGFAVLAEDGADPVEIDFGPKAPIGASATMFELEEREGGAQAPVLGLATVAGNANVDGPLASGVPRTLLGLLTTHARFGCLPRTVVLQPAIEAAHTGFAPDAWFITSALGDIERLRSDPVAREVFLDGRGLPKGAGTDAGYGQSFAAYPMITQPLLGRTLETAAHAGPDVLVDGEIADGLVQTSRQRGGLLTPQDLRAAEPAVRAARRLRYRGSTVAAPHAPSGALTELQALNVWQRVRPGAGLPTASGADLRALALTLRHAFADRYHWLGDPAVREVPVEELLSDAYADELAEQVTEGSDVPGWREGAPWLTYASRAAHDPRATGSGLRSTRSWSPAGATRPTSGTTHISAADAQGRVISITHTAANHFGSGIVCPRTGLLLDSAMAWFNAAPGAANSIGSGARALANMGPVVVLGDDGTKAAIGASGGRRIVSAVTQLVIALVDGGSSAREALAVPRIDASGRSLVVPGSLRGLIGDLGDLDPFVPAHSNDPFPMDFSRPNIARSLGGGRTESAILASHFNV
ncbi:gamma-glutamyltransferase [Nocardiopsis sp. NPDC055551]